MSAPHERPRPVASSARRAPPPAFLFPKSTMSKSWFKNRNFRSDPNPPRRPLRGPPGVGSAVSIGPLTPCQRPASDFCSAFVSPVWRATAFRPGAQLTAADVFRLTRGGGFYGNATHVSTAYFATRCKTLSGLASEHKTPRQRRKRGLRKSRPTRKGRAI